MAKWQKAKCDVCARPGALGFQLVRHVKNADGRWSSKSNGTIYLCQDCWLRGPAKRVMWRRGHGKSASTLRRRRAAARNAEAPVVDFRGLERRERAGGRSREGNVSSLARRPASA